MSTQLLGQIDNSDFNALPAEEDRWTGAIPDSEDIIQLTTPTQEEEKEIQAWCVSEHAALPFHPLETSDGTVDEPGRGPYVNQPCRRPHVNEPLYWDDMMGPLLRFCCKHIDHHWVSCRCAETFMP